MNATAEQEYTSELHIDVEVYKEDGTFVARAPLVVSTEVTLGDLKIAVEVNTKGALPPHRQKLQYNDKALPEDDTIPLRRFTGIPKRQDQHSSHHRERGVTPSRGWWANDAFYFAKERDNTVNYATRDDVAQISHRSRVASTPTCARGRHTMAIIPRRTISRSCHVCALYGRPSSLMKSFGASCIAQR